MAGEGARPRASHKGPRQGERLVKRVRLHLERPRLGEEDAPVARRLEEGHKPVTERDRHKRVLRRLHDSEVLGEKIGRVPLHRLGVGGGEDEIAKVMRLGHQTPGADAMFARTEDAGEAPVVHHDKPLVRLHGEAGPPQNHIHKGSHVSSPSRLSAYARTSFAIGPSGTTGWAPLMAGRGLGPPHRRPNSGPRKRGKKPGAGGPLRPADVRREGLGAPGGAAAGPEDSGPRFRGLWRALAFIRRVSRPERATPGPFARRDAARAGRTGPAGRPRTPCFQTAT